MQCMFDLIKVPTGGPQMIWVSSREDNNFEASSGCKIHVLIQLHNGNVLGKPYKITITIDRDQAWIVKTQIKATNCFILNIDSDDRIFRIKDSNGDVGIDLE